ncbi:Ig-like domain-containing protein, partial [Mesorhizobium denitrificans]
GQNTDQTPNTISFNVTSINDAPAGADKTITTNEDTAYTFAVADFGFSDPNDSPANAFQDVIITTLPASGTLLLNGVAVTAGQVITVAQIPTLTWTPPANGNGTAVSSFTFQVRDNGGTANGGQNTDQTPNTISFNVSAVNDAPVNTLPAQSGNEDAGISLTGLAVSDIDAGSGNVEVTLSVPAGQGTLAATGSGGVTITGSGTNTLVLTGTVADINTFLSVAGTRPVFNQGVADFNGTVALTMTTSDLGNTGIGGALTDTDTVQITINAVTDIANDTATTNEDTAATISPFANDTFENSGRTLTAINGTAIVAGGAAVTVANGTVSLSADGNTLTFTPTANYNGTTSFTYTVTSGGVTETATVNVAVNSVNDAPVNTAPANYTKAEDDGGLQLTGLSISDVDAGSSGMTVTLAVPGGSGTLTATDSGGVTVSGSGTNSLVLSGSQAAINAYLASGSAPTFVQVADFNGTVNVTMTTSDLGNTGSGGTQTAVTVIPINISAVADITNDTIAAIEDTAITFNVITGTNGATADSFENAGRLVTAIDGSTFTPGTPISITGGTITVATDGTVTFTPNTDYNGSTSFTYTVTSGGVTETATVTLNIAAVNDAPVNTVPGAQTTAEDVALAISGISVADVDSTNLTTTLTIPAGAGLLGVTDLSGGATVTGNGTGTVQISGTASEINSVLATLIYTPTADFNNGAAGSFNLGVATSDGLLTANSTVSVRVTPVADIVNDVVQTNEDTAVSFNVLTGLNEVSGTDNFEGSRTVTAIDGAAFVAGSPIAVTGGSITVQADGSVIFTPTSNFNGTTTFTYSVSAGGGSTPVETATVTITTSAVNDAPVNTLPASYTVAEDAPLKLSGLSVADVDAGSANITVTLSVPSGSGTLTALNGGSVTVSGSGSNVLVLTGTLANINAYLGSASAPDFVQVADFNGSVALTMTTDDGGATGTGGALSDTDTININITPVADIANDSVTTNEDTAVAITPLSNDSFENSGRQITAIDGVAITAGGPAIAVANGTVSMAADGVTLTFTPDANYNGATTFQYTVSSGGATETATVTVNVTGVNDAPVNTLPASYTTPEDSPLQLTGLSIADVDAGSSSVSITLSVTAGTLQAVSGSGVTVSGAGSSSLTLQGTVAALNAYLASAAAPSFTQSPADFNGAVQLTMVTNDGGATGTGGAQSDTDTVTINITPVVDIQNDSVSTNEDTDLTFNVITGTGGASADSFEGSPAVTQINGASFTAGVPIAITGGTITVQANGTVLFDPALNYNGTTGFTYTVTSGGVTETATVTITVAAENDAPTVTSPIADRTDNDSDAVSLNISGNFTDVDNPTLSYSATGLPPGLSINTVTGVISGTITASASTTDPYTVTVTATDAGGLSVSDTFVWTVLNPAPVAGNDAGTVTEDVTFNVPAASGLLSNDTDTDGDALSVANFTIAGNPTVFTAGQTATITGVGTLTIRADGSYTFVPAPNYNGSVPVATYTVTDGEGGTDTATLTLSVTAVDDPEFVGGLNDGPVSGTDGQVYESNLPSGTNPSGTGENTSGSFTIATADGVTSVSVGGTVISYAQLQTSGATPISVTTAHGTVTINGYDAATGTVSYTFALTSAADHSGGQVIEAVAIVLTDGDGDTASGTLGILINDDAPIANNDQDATINVAGNPSSQAGGNVLTGLDNPSAPDLDPADGTADVPGADGGLTVTAVGIGALAPTPGNVGTAIAGSYGTFSLDASGNYIYTPDYANPTVAALIPPATLTDTFTYIVTDADGSTATATVRITINGTPTILGLGDGPVAGTDGNVLESDLPTGTNAVGTGETLNGEFRAIAGQHGLDSISIDGQIVTNAQLLNLATTPVTVATGEGTFTLTGYNAVSGEVTYRYTLTAAVAHPATGILTDDIDLIIRDGLGNLSEHTLRINIVDDVPIANNDTNSVTEDNSDNTADGNVLTNDKTGADVDATPVTAVGFGTGAPSGAPGSTVNGTYGSLVLNDNGTYVYTLDNSRPATSALTQGQIVTEVFTYQITDGDGDSTTATLTVTITGSNDAPTVVTPIADQSNQDGATVSVNISGAFADADSPALTYALASGSTLPAGLVLNPTTGVISGTLDNSASQGGVGGIYSITVIASDGQGGTVQDTFNWTISNPVPVAVNDTLTVGENSNGSGNALGNDSDPDGDTLTVVGVGQGANPSGGIDVAVAGSNGGLFTVSANGSYIFEPGTSFDDLKPGEQRTTTVNYRISDGEGGFAVATITVTVNGANDAPQAVDDIDGTTEDVDATGNVLSNDVDVDNSAADLEVRSFSVAGDATVYAAGATATIAGVGTIVINADGTYTFNPVTNYFGNVPVITYTMADGPASNPNSLTDTATLTITVTDENDDPVAASDTLPVVEDTPATGNVLTNDTDVDGDPLTVTGFTIGANSYSAGATATIPNVGTLLLTANGAFTFTPALNYNGPVPVIIYAVSDGQGGSDTATLTLGPVSPMNDAPVAQNDAFATNQNTSINGDLFANNGSGV